MPYGITQCYLPPGSGDIPALSPAEAGTRLSHSGWVVVFGEVQGQICGVYYARNFPVGRRDRLQIGGAVDDDDDDDDGQKLETRLSVICRRRRRLHD